MHKRFFYLLTLTAIGCFSCQKTEQKSTYFDSLANTSLQELLKQQATLAKKVHIASDRDSITLKPDSAYWANDLDVFRQLAVFQKPAYRDAYHVEDGLADSESNLTVRQYKAIQNTPVPLLRFYYYHSFNQLKKIEAHYQEENALYATHRRLIMEFEDVAGAPQLSYYAVDGFQKMIFSDSTFYSVHAAISLP